MTVSYDPDTGTVTIDGRTLHVPENVAADEIDGTLISTMTTIHGTFETAAFQGNDVVFEHRTATREHALAVHGWLVEQVKAGADPAVIVVPADCPVCGGAGEVQPGRDPQVTRRCDRCYGTGEVRP